MASDLATDFANLDDAAFARLYRERIEPCFVANEEGRIAAVAAFKRRGLIALGVTIVVAVLAWVVTRNWVAGAVIAMFGVIGGGIYAYLPLAKVAEKLKREYCAAIAQAMGASFQIGAFQPPAFERIKQLRLVPNFDRSHFEDLFQGAYKDSRFDLYEARLEQRRTDSKGRTHYTTVFRGQLINMHFPRAFLGTTIVRRDAGVFNAFGGGGKLERVRLTDPQFERTFEVWGTDQVEARYLVHPVMMERLLGMERGLHGKRLRCAFEGGDLLVAVEGGNLFEPGDLFKPLVDPARARRIVDEIAGVVRVMDQVLTAQARRA
ncbi:MAG: DUF3137 domain-containing protein [Terricaulis sp.]